ncbi:MAG TPA: CHAT domain-containing protein [Thermoanaerobaculia bacterium]
MRADTSLAEGSLLPGAKQSFPVAVQGGQFLRVELEVNGRDFELSLLGPTGERLASARNMIREPRPLAVSLIAVAAGEYRVELSLPEKGATTLASYRCRVTGPVAAAPSDEKRVAADKAFAAADASHADGSKASRLKAIEEYQEALGLWRAIGDLSGEAAAHSSLGSSFAELGNLKPAQEHFDQALRGWKSLDDPARQVECLISRGWAYIRAGDLREAEAAIQAAVPLVGPLGDPYREALVDHVLGAARYTSGDLAEAQDLYRRAAALAEKAGNRHRQTMVLDGYARVLQAQGDQVEAVEILSGNLPFYREAGDRRLEMYAINSIGVAHSNMGHTQQALDTYRQVWELSRSMGDTFMEDVALANVGLMYLAMDDPERALACFNQCITLSRANHQTLEEARTSQHIGAVYNEMGEPTKSIEYCARALNLLQNLDNPVAEAESRTTIGDAYARLGQPRKALEFFDAAIETYRANGRLLLEAGALASQGEALVSLGETARGSEALERALAQLRGLNWGNLEAHVLTDLARIAASRNRVTEAKARVDAALAAIESFRGGITGTDQRSSFLAKHFSVYEAAIEVLMELHRRKPAQGFAAQAFEISERARARSLLDLLGESRAGIRSGVAPELLKEERSVSDRLAAKARYRLQVLGGPHSEAQTATLDRELRTLTDVYAGVQARIRESSPAYAGLTQPRALSLSGVQELLDEDTMLLEYSLGGPRSVLWAVTKTSFAVYDMSGRKRIEGLARQVYQEMISKVPLEKADAAKALGRVLLGPVDRQLGSRRLVVVADGILQYISFAALPGRGDAPLSANHTIAYLPSASTLPLIREEIEGRKPAPKLVAVLADPVYTRDDSRVQGAAPAAAPVPTSGILERSAKDTGFLEFGRLYSTRNEAKAILDLAEPGARLSALDFQASRETATGASLSQYRIVHFAAHGLLNSRQPELSGLVLSLVTAKGTPANGFLQAYEIYNLKLGADLVVLSACQTALGKDVRGEGLLGLTRAFMYAGAPRVVATLWPVPDVATAELMKRFYRAMLVDHVAPAAALRQAQESLRHEARWSAPYYWAGFTLQGEWN